MMASLEMQWTNITRKKKQSHATLQNSYCEIELVLLIQVTVAEKLDIAFYYRIDTFLFYANQIFMSHLKTFLCLWDITL